MKRLVLQEAAKCIICQEKNKVKELIRKYEKGAMGECSFTDQLLSRPPLSDMVTHKGVVSSIPQCD